MVPVYRAVVKLEGFSALNRLNPSAIASTRARPPNENAFETRSVNDDSDAPRPQLMVVHAPMSLTIGLLLESRPSNANAVVAMSLFDPFWFRSTPSVVATGNAER